MKNAVFTVLSQPDLIDFSVPGGQRWNSRFVVFRAHIEALPLSATSEASQTQSLTPSLVSS